MSSGMAKKLPRVVLDTNILISALVFGGKPEKVYNLVLEKEIESVTSLPLIAELIDTLIKKFHFEQYRIEQLKEIINDHFLVTYPTQSLELLQDIDDNRVLEAAIEGKCNFIVTGDKELLDLKIFRKIKIVTADQFLTILSP